MVKRRATSRNWQYSEADFDRQFEEAIQRGRGTTLRGPHALDVKYDWDSGRIVLKLDNDTVFAFPATNIEELVGASPENIAEVSVVPGGRALRWGTLDVDLGVLELVKGIFGTRSWMTELAYRGGIVTSEAKAAAARENGRKGGRPKSRA